jgi:hypothetical protein
MSGSENFLTRWSRRKRDVTAAEPPAAPEAGKPAAQGEENNQKNAARSLEANMPPAPPAFDITKLPSLDSIGATSDIRPFLQAGVPSALRNAALRRAWAADPAIRDFVGLSENAWDFTVPGGAPGFGELDPHLDLKKLVAEIFGEGAPDSKAPADAAFPAPVGEQSSQLPDKSDSTADIPAASDAATATPQQHAALTDDALLRRDSNFATQQDAAKQEPVAQPVRRHGGAMPQ